MTTVRLYVLLNKFKSTYRDRRCGLFTRIDFELWLRHYARLVILPNRLVAFTALYRLLRAFVSLGLHDAIKIAQQ